MSVKLKSVLILSTIVMVLISETTTSEYSELSRDKREDTESETETVAPVAEKPSKNVKKGEASKDANSVIQVEDIQRELEKLKDINLEKVGPKNPSKVDKMLKEAAASAKKELENPVKRQ